jgi:hypothetical protein
VAEWSIATVLKTVERESVPWVRIPPPPPLWNKTGHLARLVCCACQCSEQITRRSHDPDFAGIDLDSLRQSAKVVAVVAGAVETDALTGGLGELSQHFRRYGLMAGGLEHRRRPFGVGLGLIPDRLKAVDAVLEGGIVDVDNTHLDSVVKALQSQFRFRRALIAVHYYDACCALYFLDACFVQFLLPRFEVNGRQHAVVGVLTFRVVEHLDVFERVLPCSVACGVCAPPDPFPLQQLEEALGQSMSAIGPRTMDLRVIMSVPSSAHACIQIVLTQKRLPRAAGELRTLIRMGHDPVLGFATPDGGQQRLQRKIGRHAGLSRPADDTAREQVDHDRKVEPTFMGLDVGNITRHCPRTNGGPWLAPNLVRRSNFEMPIQSLVSDHRRLASVSSRSALVANLCDNASQAGQTRNTVL